MHRWHRFESAEHAQNLVCLLQPSAPLEPFRAGRDREQQDQEQRSGQRRDPKLPSP